MAVLENKGGGGGLQIEELCPQGTHVAVIGRIDDRFGVERPKYENPTETEKVDETRFTFGVVVDGAAYRVQTYPFRISGHPKSNLVKFLTALLGRPPKLGWDYCELVGSGCIITVEHKENRDGTRTYAAVTAVRPVKDSLSDYSDRVPQMDWFDWGEALESAPTAPEPRAAPAPVAPPASKPANAAPAAPTPRQPKAPSKPAKPAPRAPAKPAAPAWSPDSEDECPF